MRELAILVTVIVIIILLIWMSPLPRTSEPSPQVEKVTTIPLVPAESKDYCPYRSLIGTWHTKNPNAPGPNIVIEYKFSTLRDGKTIMLTVNHIGPDFRYTRGACILSNFSCLPGFVGDITINATCTSTNNAGLNPLKRKFQVVSTSKNTIMHDSSTNLKFYKQEK
jgi:hypothetical protein